MWQHSRTSGRSASGVFSLLSMSALASLVAPRASNLGKPSSVPDFPPSSFAPFGVFRRERPSSPDTFRFIMPNWCRLAPGLFIDLLKDLSRDLLMDWLTTPDPGVAATAIVPVRFFWKREPTLSNENEAPWLGLLPPSVSSCGTTLMVYRLLAPKHVATSSLVSACLTIQRCPDYVSLVTVCFGRMLPWYVSS